MTDALLEHRVADVVAMSKAVKHILNNGELPIGLFGSSMGGATSIAAASLLKPSAMVTVAALVDGSPLVSALTESDIDLPDGTSPEAIGAFDLVAAAKELNRLLIIHGDSDELVPMDHAKRLFEAAHDPKRLVLLPDGDHRLSRPDHQIQFLEEATSWFIRHLSPDGPHGPQ